MSKELTNYFLSVGLIVTGTFFCIGTYFLQWGSRRKFTSFPALVGFVFVGYFGHLTTWYLAGFAFMVCLLFFLILMDVSNIMFLQMLFRFYPNLRGRAKGGGFGAVGDDYDFEHGIVGMVLLLPISIILYLLIRNWARGPFSELLYGSVTICALALLVRKLGMSMDTIIKTIIVRSRSTDSFIDTRDGREYRTVKIGNQIWMAENLQYGPGEAFGLYKYDEAVTSCPSGWHLPTKGEWDILINHLGGMSVAGGKMKATKLWIRPNKDATNSSGFSAFPPKSNSHSSSVDYAHFWSRDPGQRDKISIFYVCNYTSEVQINYTHDWSRISVRCVKD